MVPWIIHFDLTRQLRTAVLAEVVQLQYAHLAIALRALMAHSTNQAPELDHRANQFLNQREFLEPALLKTYIIRARRPQSRTDSTGDLLDEPGDQDARSQFGTTEPKLRSVQ